MKTKDFPFCCTARIVMDFGQSAVSEGMQGIMTVKKIQDYISDELNSMYNRNLAMITAVTNNDQENANQALRNLGFEHSTWMAKKQHPETKVRLWWKSLDKFRAEEEDKAPIAVKAAKLS